MEDTNRIEIQKMHAFYHKYPLSKQVKKQLNEAEIADLATATVSEHPKIGVPPTIVLAFNDGHKRVFQFLANNGTEEDCRKAARTWQETDEVKQIEPYVARGFTFPQTKIFGDFSLVKQIKRQLSEMQSRNIVGFVLQEGLGNPATIVIKMEDNKDLAFQFRDNDGTEEDKAKAAKTWQQVDMSLVAGGNPAKEKPAKKKKVTEKV